MVSDNPSGEELDQLDKPSFVYLAFVFAVLISQGVFINKPSGGSPALAFPYVGQIGWKLAVHTEEILLVVICLYVVLSITLVFSREIFRNSKMGLWFLFAFYVFLMTIFQEHSSNQNAYHSQLIVSFSMVACAIAVSSLSAKPLYFFVRTAQLLINGLSLFLSLFSTPFTFTDQLTGGVGFNSRLIGITPSPTVLALFASLVLVFFVSERDREIQLNW